MLDIVVLAAGMGTRFKSRMIKMLHPVAGRPMLLEVLATARALEARHTVIVVGHDADAVKEAVGTDASFAFQAEQLGTGHAVLQAKDHLQESRADTLLVLYGDTPLTKAETLSEAVRHHEESEAAVTLLSFLPDDSTGYGRVVRNEQGEVSAIVEHKDASESQRAIRESNSGIMLFDAPWLWENLDRLSLSPQGEYYLTDMAGLAVSQKRKVQGIVVDEQEVMGINNRVQLAEASRVLWDRRREYWMKEGVTLVDPATTWLDADVTIGRDTVIQPSVSLVGSTTIGSDCEIGSFVLLKDATVPDGVVIPPFTYVNGEEQETYHVLDHPAQGSLF